VLTTWAPPPRSILVGLAVDLVNASVISRSSGACRRGRGTCLPRRPVAGSNRIGQSVELKSPVFRTAAGLRWSAPFAAVRRRPSRAFIGAAAAEQGLRYPPDPPTVEEIIAVMRALAIAPTG
jgi:hypothetical protein